MMNKYIGKYDILWKNLVNKYGTPGQPIIATNEKVTSTSDPIFNEMIKKVTPTTSCRRDISAVDSKATKSQNGGLETSTFTGKSAFVFYHVISNVQCDASVI